VRGLSPKKKSRLPPQGKAVVAAFALIDTLEGRIDETAAGLRLRGQVELSWSFLTCLQYLSGQEALRALRALLSNWSQDGHTKRDLFAATLLAAHTVANVLPNGVMLCASHLADELKGKDLAEWMMDRAES
jgi:hypothetical protein